MSRVEAEAAFEKRLLELSTAIFRLSGSEVLEDLARGLCTKEQAHLVLAQLLVSTREFARTSLRRSAALPPADRGPRCPCGGIILADTEEWPIPLCVECHSKLEDQPAADPHEQGVPA